MMTKEQHLLGVVAEEACEAAHRALKALRFGLGDRDPGSGNSAAFLLQQEVSDFVAVVEMLEHETGIAFISQEAIAKKKEKVEEFMQYSRNRGILE